MTRLKQGLCWLRRHLHFKVVFPAIVAAGLLAYVASLASTPGATQALALVTQKVWWIVLLLTIPYLAARAYVWNDLLQELGLAVPLRQLLLAFAAGEIAKSLPAGEYVENYLLRRLAHLDEEQTVRSTAATTAMLGLETALALAVVLIVGLPGETWLRWVLLGIVGAWLVVIAATWLLIRREAHKQSHLPTWLRHALTDAERFLADGGALLQRRTVRNLAPTALYMFVYVVDLYVIMQALGLHLGWVACSTIYAATVLAVVLIPIPTEIGIADITTLGALTAFGVPPHTAAVASLALRILATGSTILLAGLLFLALRGELTQASAEHAHGSTQRASGVAAPTAQDAGSPADSSRPAGE
jgi:uncharacterized membrane protein YbhN (UPF0104 family)